jgi:hypothetical protein
MMRPQDILILLAIVDKQGKPWMGKDLAYELGISGGEISESLRRSKKSGLYDEANKSVNRQALFDFLIYGLRYVFPAQSGNLTKGVPTTVSTAPLNSRTDSTDRFVWAHPKGTLRGQSISPLYPSVPDAAMRSTSLHALFALTDTLRAGKIRERELAKQELEKLILVG